MAEKCPSGKCDDKSFSYELIKSIADYIMEHISVCPKVGIICGTGLGSLADGIADPQKIEYKDIPNFPATTVVGHAGILVAGTLEGVPVMAMQGRFHYYEGYPMGKCSMPVRVMKLMGIEVLIVTNAAGGINPSFNTGDIMFIRDHINFPGLVGNSSLRGPNIEDFGPRFPDMKGAYTPDLIAKGTAIAKEMGIQDTVRVGTYCCVGGPSYETIAEVKFLKLIGADAVGMSTAHEVIMAKHCGLNVFSFSLITNTLVADYDKQADTSHEEVIAVGKNRQSVCCDFVRRMVKSLSSAERCTCMD